MPSKNPALDPPLCLLTCIAPRVILGDSGDVIASVVGRGAE